MASTFFYTTDGYLFIYLQTFFHTPFAEKKEFDVSTHSLFLNKIMARKLSHNRVKIFTLNYDTAFENAAVESDILLIDGFNFSPKLIFNDRFFDYDIVKKKENRIASEDNFIQKVAYLYKLHGSINWIRSKKEIKKNIDDKSEDFVMVIPSQNKFEQSYKKPYVDMMSRFRLEIQRNATSTLLIIGYSFGDEHINSIILEAINNSKFNIVVVSPSVSSILNKGGNAEFVATMLDRYKQGNIAFINDTFKNFVNNLQVQQSYSKEEKDHEPE